MTDIENFDFENKRVIIRVDFNIPLGNLSIVDHLRINASIPTIRKVVEGGGIPILLSHLGRPKGRDMNYSLKHLLPILKKLLGENIFFANDSIGNDSLNLIKDRKKGEIVLLENVRFYKEEKNCDEKFSQKLAELGDVYINDAFGTSHRNHASVVGIPKFINQKMMGYLMKEEVKNANIIIQDSKKPFTLIVGGAKVSDKINMLIKLIEKKHNNGDAYINNILIGGGMANTFLKASGFFIARSFYENESLKEAKYIIDLASQNNINLLLPIDYNAGLKLDSANSYSYDIEKLPEDMMILDIGPKTQSLYSDTILKSKMILWNGPMGLYENPIFIQGSKSIATSITDATKNGAFSLVGGGDSTSVIYKLSLEKGFSYISTGGGALMSYIANEKLDGIEKLS